MNTKRTSLIMAAGLALLISFPASAAEGAPAPCGDGMVRFSHEDNGYSVCVPAGWQRRARGTEVVWSPDQGLDLVFSFQTKVVQPRDVSAPLVGYLLRKKATLHVSSSGALKYHLDGVDGVGLVKHQHRYGLLIYTQCSQPGKACNDLVRTAIDVARTVHLDPGSDARPYDQWKVRNIGGLELRGPSGSPAAKDLDWLAAEYAKGHEKLLTALGAPPAKEPLCCYFYRSEDENFGYTRRGSGFNIAGGAGEVHSLFAARNDRQSTGHEMTHAITNRVWGEPAEALLGEGIAVAQDLSGIDHDARARKAITNIEPDLTLASMLGDAWFRHDMEVSYAVSGSVVKFLLAQGTTDKVKALYQAPDFKAALQKHFGWSLKELEKRWRWAIRADPAL